jgi:purine-binding chemotaxis protein CheW
VTDAPVPAKLAALRRDFDASFAAPPPERAEESERLLLIRSGGEALAMRIGELAGLVKERKVVPLPGTSRELLGIAGIRGRLVPVYSLARLLRAGARAEDERWLALCDRDGLAALAFSAFEGYATVARAELSPSNQTGGATDAVVRVASVSRAVLSVAAVVAAIRANAAATSETRPEKSSGDRIE